MMTTNFLLLHGYGGKHIEHWQTYLANSLKEQNQTVVYPDFPNPDMPKLDLWLDFLHETLKNNINDKLVVATHSLGCSFWLQYISRYPNTQTKKVFLVSPPLNDCGIMEIADFFPLPNLNLSKKDYQIIGSSNDNFILKEEFETLAKQLNVPLKIIPNAGHINAPMYGNWEWMNNECLS